MSRWDFLVVQVVRVFFFPFLIYYFYASVWKLKFQSLYSIRRIYYTYIYPFGDMVTILTVVLHTAINRYIPIDTILTYRSLLHVHKEHKILRLYAITCLRAIPRSLQHSHCTYLVRKGARPSHHKSRYIDPRSCIPRASQSSHTGAKSGDHLDATRDFSMVVRARLRRQMRCV